MAHGNVPAGGRHGALQECRFNPVPGIADTAHVNVSPNPGAALSTSPIRPDFSRLERLRHRVFERPLLREERPSQLGIFNDLDNVREPRNYRARTENLRGRYAQPALGRPPGKQRPSLHPVIDGGARHPEPRRCFRGPEGFVTAGSANDERLQSLRHVDPIVIRLALRGRRFKRDGHGEARLPRMLHDKLPGAFRQHRNSLHEKLHRLFRRSAQPGHRCRAPNLPS